MTPYYSLDVPNETDLDGQPRIVNARLDMGADEYVSSGLRLVAVYDDISINLIEDSEGTYRGQTTVYLDVFYRVELVAQARAVSAAGGIWSVDLDPGIIGPGQDIAVELSVEGTDVDIQQLTIGTGDVVLTTIEMGGILAP